jgi:hypothetical protein
MLYEIIVQLKDIDPPIWRTILVPGRTRLSRLHRALQIAMGWKTYHVHVFTVGDTDYGEPSPDWGKEVLDHRKVTLERVLATGQTSFEYEYDLGDGWRHEITLIGTRPAEGQEQLACIDGDGACPPEDCGGPWGYRQLLVALSDPDHKEHYSLLRWVGGRFDPRAFDAAAVDKALKRLR